MADMSNVGGPDITGATTESDYYPGGWQLYAGCMILFVGVWNACEGLFGFIRSSYFIGKPVFGDLWVWAVLWLLFGLLQVVAGYAILGGRSWGRWFGIVVASLSALVAMLTIGTYPFWALVVIALDFAVIYGLTAHWRRPVTG
jgi:hypothetical protein